MRVGYIFTICSLTFFVVAVAAQNMPYHKSSILAGIEIDWSTHKRFANGSDNFSLTWADDNHQYGPWGDGGGFGGTNDLNRVSLGIARIEGPSDDYKGYDRYGHSNSAESTATLIGKSWGILCVDGILYMWVHPDKERGGGSWVHHQKESRLYRSANKGGIWDAAEWSFTKQDGLLGGNILQFGMNYSGARDNYTYHYFVKPGNKLDVSGNINELQKPGQIFLARVDKDKLMHKDAYEFFAGMHNGNPLWAKDIKGKKPVFQDRNGVGMPVGICYNPGLKRYLLTTEHVDGERGNFGLFEGATPWGPWATVVYMLRSNGTAFGHDHQAEVPPNTFFWTFPTKWIANNGYDLTLTFTGAGLGENNDSFNTVRVRLKKK